MMILSNAIARLFLTGCCTSTLKVPHAQKAYDFRFCLQQPRVYTPMFPGLPIHLDGELDFHRRLLTVRKQSDLTCPRWRSVGVKKRSVAVATARLRRHEVVVVGDVEKLRPELDVERFRDALDREILENREIQVHKPRAV